MEIKVRYGETEKEVRIKTETTNSDKVYIHHIDLCLVKPVKVSIIKENEEIDIENYNIEKCRTFYRSELLHSDILAQIENAEVTLEELLDAEKEKIEQIVSLLKYLASKYKITVEETDC